MMGLTQAQQECLEYLRKRTEHSDVSPSYDEIRAALGLRSKSGVYRLLHGLRQRGYIDFIPGHARTLRVIEPEKTVSVKISESDFRRIRDFADQRKLPVDKLICRWIDQESMEAAQ